MTKSIRGSSAHTHMQQKAAAGALLETLADTFPEDKYFQNPKLKSV